MVARIKHRTKMLVVSDVELQYGLMAEANVEFSYTYYPEYKGDFLTPREPAHMEIDGWDIKGITVEDHGCDAICISEEVKEEEIMPIIDLFISANEERFIEEIEE